MLKRYREMYITISKPLRPDPPRGRRFLSTGQSGHRPSRNALRLWVVKHTELY